jgi:hypothetical protein
LGTGGMLTGPVNNNVFESKFDNIYTSAIIVTNGSYNASKNNKYYNVGNNAGTSASATVAVIDFGSLNNTSEGDWFERSADLGYDETFKNGVVYHPEVKGPTITEFGTTHKLTIGQSGEYTKLFRLPAETTKGYEIDYIYKSSYVAASRTGTLTLVVDPVNDTYNISDDYEYTGNNTYAENLKFKAQNYDENGDTVIDTTAIMMLNLTVSDTAILYYKVKTKS